MLTFLHFLLEEKDNSTHWHGSPHDFNEFSRKNTAHTGEGGAAYGSGIYISDTKEVGEHYRDYNKQSKTRRLYELKLKSNPDRMMHWHKKFSDQTPTVKAALKKSAPDYDWHSDSDPHARHIFHHIRSSLQAGGATRVEASEYASKTLYNNGIHGIEYRGDMEGKAKVHPNNKVIFNPKHIKIISKYDENGNKI